MGALIRLLDGWKSILGYLLMSLPFLTPYPMLKSALEALLENTTRENIINAIVQLILALGIADRIRKNLRGK